MSKKLVVVIVLVLIIVGLSGLGHHASRPNSQQTNHTSSFNKQLYSIDQASSLWVIVNKGRQLPTTYVPANLVTPTVPLRLGADDPEMHLRADAAAALEKLFSAATGAGLKYHLSSGYRSYQDQLLTYQGFVSQAGADVADESSARPGHSEHQTGLAADIGPLNGNCDIEQCFANTPEGQWLAANSYKYGFIIRYKDATQPIVGYEYEPWHIRYVGVELAAQLQKTGQTLEQFFGLPPAPNYPVQSKVLAD